MEASSKVVGKQPSKYIHLRTSSSDCKITKKLAISSDFLTLIGDGVQSARFMLKCL